MRLLADLGTPLAGARAVVIGRSVLVGKPIAYLLANANATVTMCHSRTKDLAAEVKRAEIVVAAVGKPEMIRGEWIADGAIVIDVGINRIDKSDERRTRSSAAGGAKVNDKSRRTSDA